MALDPIISRGLLIASSIFFILVALFALMRSRYKKFTNREFVLRFRNGTLKNQGYGGGYFLLPLIDELIVLTTTIQNLEIDVAEKIITSENQDVRINGFVVWRIEDPVKAYQSISGSQGVGVMTEINRTLEQLVESIIRTTVAQLSLDQVLRERSLILEAIMSELLTVVGPMGIQINTTEIRHVEVVDGDLFHDLQETYRQEARLTAEKVKINTQMEIDRTEAVSQQKVRTYQAEQEEVASIRELEKDRSVLLQQQKLNETEQNRLMAVQELEKNRETKIAGIEQKKLQIEANTKLIQTELDAESKKRRMILEQVDVEAQKRKLMAEAEAEAIRITAEAERDAANLKKEGMKAEAEGKKALLFAEAAGLQEKVKAQGHVNEAMIMYELIKLLPDIASSMKVGDVNWLNLGGNNGDGSSPLGIIPKNIVEMLGIAKSFGLDVNKMVQKLNGNPPSTVTSPAEEIMGGIDPDHLVPLDTNHDGHYNALDLDNDGLPDFVLPDGVYALDLNSDGKIDGFDLNGDGVIEVIIDEIDFSDPNAINLLSVAQQSKDTILSGIV